MKRYARLTEILKMELIPPKNFEDKKKKKKKRKI